ncbi:hypothetical protein PI124_g4788 [Phytophthora idaei]|nr:hypothetical protein PI125_g2298 [Phytophthora idaei]KAG3165731.1 hypothetical protein PI126_g4481 [Phytophthora idaei]KAG3250554.1 hypothetical protein PI124_g4788 [Phytophthora idaei]
MLHVAPIPNAAIEQGPNDITAEKYWLKEVNLIYFVEGQGTFVKNYMQNLEETDKQTTLKQLGRFVQHVIESLELVQAEWDSNNDAAVSVAPPVRPSELVLLPPREFAGDILESRRAQLAKFWSEAQIEAIERENRELCQANLLDEAVSTGLDNESYKTSFNDGWNALEKAAVPKQFSHLRQFCCGTAIVFANTASVESDFSILKWELNDCRSSLASLAMEGRFQAKQFDLLNKL